MDAQETPEPVLQPQPVYDVTYSHVYAPGAVFKQYYMFLWIGVAMLIGAILPWRGLDESQMPNLMQAILIVFAVGAIWTGIASIKSRRLTLWPFLALELVASMFLVLHYRNVTDLRDNNRFHVLEEMNQTWKDMGADSAESEAFREEFNRVKDASDWGVLDLVTGHFKTFGSQVDPVVRAKYEAVWNTFGTGFYLTGLCVLFMFFFIIGSIVFAVIKAKPKEEVKPRRRERPSPRGKTGDDDAGKDEAAKV